MGAIRRLGGSLVLVAVCGTVLAGCGVSPALRVPVIVTATSAGATVNSTGYERYVLRYLADRYPGASITLMDMYYTGPSQYRFNASVQGRRVSGTYDSYTGRVALDNGGGGQPYPGNDYQQVRQIVLRALDERFPGAMFGTLDLKAGYNNGDYDFSVRVDGRIVTGRYDAYSGRVIVNDGGGQPYPGNGQTAEVKRDILRQLTRRFPGTTIDVEDAIYDPKRYDYRWQASVDRNVYSGRYDARTGSLTIEY